MPLLVKAKLGKKAPAWEKTYEQLKRNDTDPLSDSEEDPTEALDSQDKSIEIELYTDSGLKTQKDGGDTSRRGAPPDELRMTGTLSSDFSNKFGEKLKLDMKQREVTFPEQKANAKAASVSFAQNFNLKVPEAAL